MAAARLPRGCAGGDACDGGAGGRPVHGCVRPPPLRRGLDGTVLRGGILPHLLAQRGGCGAVRHAGGSRSTGRHPRPAAAG